MKSLDNNAIRSALAELGEQLRLDRQVEILIAGGAAGILISALPPEMTTSDADAICFHLPQDREQVLDAAAEVGKKLSLPSDWLNDWSGLFAWTLPTGWESRRIHVGTYGRLRAYATARVDLIAMKFISHRQRDLEHLVSMNVSSDELRFVGDHLNRLASQYPQGRYPDQAGKIEMALRIVTDWEKPR